jgi:hypothetical protein
MRWMRPIVSALTLALTTAAHADPTQYLCITEQAGGLHYDASWQAQVFSSGRRYLLRRANDDDLKNSTGNAMKYFLHLDASTQVKDLPDSTHFWVVYEFGLPSGAPAEAMCGEFLNQDHHFNCLGVRSAAFMFDYKSRRFEIAYLGAYIAQARAPNDQPFDEIVQIGSCSPF